MPFGRLAPSPFGAFGIIPDGSRQQHQPFGAGSREAAASTGRYNYWRLRSPEGFAHNDHRFLLECILRRERGGGSTHRLGHTLLGLKTEVHIMALESIHACDCSNGYTYVGAISIEKVSGVGGAAEREELAVSDYYVIPTKMLVDRTWQKEIGEDNKEHYKYVPYSAVAGALYRRLRDQGTLNSKQVKLLNADANHELDF